MIPEQWYEVPEELRLVPKWCVSGPDKSPYSTSGHRASVTNPETWTDWYSASLVATQWGTGVGFILGEDDEYTCIDLDVKDADNEPDPSKWTTPEQLERFWSIVQAFDSYTERSRSGKGLHIWVKGSIGKGCRRDGVEVYSQERYIICTGDAVLAKPVEYRQGLLDILVDEIRSAEQVTHIELVEQDETNTDEEIWNKASNAANSEKFKQLCEGDWKKLNYPSQSEADLSLLSMLCFYTRSNEQVRRLFRLSGLGKRDKAQKNNRYLDLTLAIIRGRQAREDIENAKMIESGKAITMSMEKRAKLLPVETPSTLDWPPGLIGYVAQWFYSIAPRPVREVAIVSALGFFAGICGRAYNISGSGLNLYIVLVARSAIGKEAMHSGISSMIHSLLMTCPTVSKYIDFADYASGPALVKSLSDRNSFCNVAGEWGRKLRKMSDDHNEGPMSSLRTVMTNLYQKSGAGNIVGGIGYSDREKDVKSTNGVAYSMIGETTPDTFYESLTNTMMQDGFMSRFIVIEYAGLRPELNAAPKEPLAEWFLDHMRNLLDFVGSQFEGCQEVVLSKEAAELVEAFDKECDEQINSTEDESWRQMWNRAHLKTLKLSGLMAAADNHMNPIVSLEHAEWALKLVRRDIKIMGHKMQDGDVGDGDMVRDRKILSVISEYLQAPVPRGYKLPDEMRKAGVVPWKYLKIRLQKTNSFAKHRNGHTAALAISVRSLVDSGYLVEITKDKIPSEWNFQGKCFRVVSLHD